MAKKRVKVGETGGWGSGEKEVGTGRGGMETSREGGGDWERREWDGREAGEKWKRRRWKMGEKEGSNNAQYV